MGTQAFTWIDPNGTSYDLNEYWDFDGRYMPPVAFIADELPGQAGQVLRAVKHGARTIKISAVLTVDCGLTAADLQAELRTLVEAMDPTLGQGKLRVTNPGGDQREIVCSYSAGLELPEQYGSTSGKRAQKVTISFIAHQPYWQSTSASSFDFNSTTPVKFFPFFPLRLTSSQIFVNQSITNPGSRPAWPVWRITGPGSVITLKNLTTGKKMEFSNAGGLVLGDTDYLDIDTNINVKSVTLNGDTNAFKYLSLDSELWPLPKGASLIQLLMAGVDTDLSSLNLQFRSRYTTV